MPASALLAASAAVRVASLNLCTDEYLLLLAEPRQVASVSFLSQDPRDSALWRTARRFPANRGSLESVVTTKPNVMLTMGGGGRATTLIARRLGIRAIDLKPAMTIEDVSGNLRTVALALGAPRQAAPWLQRLQRLRATTPRRPTDAVWISGGGQSLAVPSAGAEWMRLAGLAQRPLPGGRMSLETMLVRPPRVLVQSDYRAGQFSRGSTWLDHPIVRRAPSRRVTTDGRAWTCMGPLMIREMERLRAAVR